VIDLDTLDTLPEREFIGGLAEVIKYGVVLDAELFGYLETNIGRLLARDKSILSHVIKRCCAIKASVVESDERESGRRAILNYGHTIGHAVEALTGYASISHGEAVAIGMALAAKISEVRGHSTPELTSRISSLLKACRLPVNPPTFPAADYLACMLRDKKVREGGLSFIFNRGIGDSIINKVADVAQLLADCGIR